MANPWEMDWGSQAGPVYGPPPKLDPYKDRDQELQEQAALRAEEDQRFQREKFEREMAKGVGVNEAGVAQSKAAGFYGRALKANEAYEATGVGPQSGVMGVARAVIPDMAEPYIIGTDRQQAEANQRAFISSVLRYESGAAIPPEEFESARKTYFPMAGESPETVATKARLRAEAIEAIRLGAGAAAGQVEQPTPQVPGGMAEQVGQSRNLAEIEAPGGDQLTRSQGTQTVANPELAGVRGEYLRRLEANQSPGEIIRFLRSAGIADPKILQSAIQQAQYRKQYPNVPIANYNTTALDQMDVPLSATESMMNEAAQSPAGAYAMNAGQTASIGMLDELAGATGGNAERVNIALQDSQNANPVASTLGQISGGVMGALGAEAGLARTGMTAGAPRALLADTSYGAALGAGSAEEGERVRGAVTGGLTAGAGSLGGQALARGVGSAVSPTGGKLSDLYAAGVRPTPGQRMIAAGDGRGLSGLVGRAVNATEEGVSSVPIVGSAIRGARQEARDQFQIGTYNQALAEVGKKLPGGMKPGTAPYSFTKKVFNEAYDKARSGMRIAPDEELASEVGELSGRIGNLAEPSVKRFESIVQNVLLRRTGETIDGASFKTIQSELGKIIAGIRKSQTGDGELADALGDLQGMLDRAARRHSDPAAVKLLDEADAGYAKFVRIRDAAKARGGEAGEFSPTQFDRSVQRNTAGKYSDAYLRGDALMQDYAQQGMSLVDRIPNSGTPERIAVGGTLAGGAAYVEPTTLGVLGILGTLYAPGVRKIVSGSMAPRGPQAKAVADAVRKRARIAGAVGAGTALSAQKDDDR